MSGGMGFQPVKLRLGTRGSELALWQAQHVAETISRATGAPSELIIIRTAGDRDTDTPMTPGAWPVGAFATEIERALTDGEIDLAVHSYKDLATNSPDELFIAATPQRGPAHDVLVCTSAGVADRFRAALTGADRLGDLVVGTSSPRRTAQLEQALGCRSAPLRGNVPTRIEKLQTGHFDAVCLAAAGIERLGLDPPHVVPLEIERFPTAPAQGAIAVQARRDSHAATLVATIDHPQTRRCTDAERAFLRGVGAGCHTPLAATASIGADGRIHMHVQLFAENELFEASVSGADPASLGAETAATALGELKR